MKSKKLLTALVACGLMVGGFAFQGQAATLTFDLNHEFSGAADPEGPAPWLTAVFDDEGTPGSVKLTLTSHLVNANFVGGTAGNNDGWLFNFNSDKTLSSLLFTFNTGTNDASSISKGADAFKADGDGFFDISFVWGNSPANNFGSGDTAVYDITGISDLVAADFNFTSAELGANGGHSGGNGSWASAAHVQGIAGNTNGNSGWIGPDGGPPPQEQTPEPGTIVLLGSGLLGLALFGRRKARR